MKKILKHFSILIILIFIAGLIPFIPGMNTPVNAAGYSSVNITATSYEFYDQSGSQTWSWYCSHGSATTVGSPGSDVYWLPDGSNTNMWLSCFSPLYRFNMSSLPAGATIKKIIFHLGNSYRGSSTYWLDDYLAFEKVNINHDTPVAGDLIYMRSNVLVTPPQIWSSLPAGSSPVDITAYNSSISNILKPTSNNYTFLSLMSLDYSYAVPVAWHNSTYQDFATSSTVKMEVFYASPPANRTMVIPANVPFTGTRVGSENVSGIYWITPRALFSDETIGLYIAGSPGALFTYSLNSGNGNLIASGNNTCGDNGYYVVSATVPVSFHDWIRLTVTDTTFNKVRYSTWGCVELPPNINELNLTTSATDSAFPQYDNDFSAYMVYKNGIGIIYWKTNLALTDMSNYSLKILAGGSASAISFNATMSWLNTNYFQTAYATNDAMAHWRYMMFTPFVSQTGFNDRDGFIMNIGQDYTVSQTGFWECLITKDADSSTLASCDTAYYYLNNINQGVAINLNDNTVMPNDAINAIITVGSDSKVGTQLRNVSVIVIDSVGNIAGSGTGFVSTGSNTITFNAPANVGDYQARFIFYDTTLTPDYEYIHDVPFTVGSNPGSAIKPGLPTKQGLIDYLNALLGRWGMDNAAGHWIFIIILCALWGGLFGLWAKLPMVATLLCILTFGIAIYINWIDKWIIALLAIAAGVAIYGIFRKGAEARKY